MTWRVFWAIVLIIAGILFLLINLGILPGNAWNYVFPAILVLLGLGLLLGLRGDGGKAAEVVNESAPLSGATSAAVTLKHGAGRLTIHAGSDPTLLFAGTFGGGVDKKLSNQNGAAFLELKTPTEVWSGMNFFGKHGLDWDVALNSSVPLALKYEGGASETKMDLTGIRLSTLDISTGASSTDIVLPVPIGTQRVILHSGAASIKLRLPQNAIASIRGTMGLGSLNVDLARFPNRGEGLYQSDNFATATDRIDLTVEGGVGSVDIR